MKIGIGAATAAFLAFSAASQAADSPVVKPFTAPPIPDWSGLYAGLGVSYGSVEYRAQPAPGVPPVTRWDADGFGVGGVLGYNLQHGRYVYGIEGQLSWPNIEGSPSNIGGAGPGTSDIEWIAALRGRVGYLVRDDLLLYITGGYARARGELSAPGFAPPTTRHATHSGWTFGIGGEWQFAPGMRIRAAVDRYELDGRAYNSYASGEANFIMSVMFLGGLNLFNTNLAASDVRLKRDIAEVGKLTNGVSLYRYRYLWNDTIYVGVMAQEVAAVMPEAVMRGADGFLHVDYRKLGTRLMTWGEWSGPTLTEIASMPY